MKVLVTGMSGFIGHHLVEHFLNTTDWKIVGLDRLSNAGNLNRLQDFYHKHSSRIKSIWHDLRSPINSIVANQIGTIDVICHLAASSHVDRSIQDPVSFVMDNVLGTTNLLQYAREIKPHKFFNFSTDEVFGPAPIGVNYKEDDRYNSGNPYSASKAGAEEMVTAFHNTYGVNSITTHCMNVFGERQHPEKFLPLVIKKCLAGETVTIHADSTKTKAGSRFYLYAKNVAAAIIFLIGKGKVGEKYNLVGSHEISNLELARKVAQMIGKPLLYEMVDFHTSRPGHDLRYALDGTKLAEMGFVYPYSLNECLKQTVDWTLEHPEWI